MDDESPSISQSPAALDSTPEPSQSPLFDKYSFAFLALCEEPEVLYEIKSDSEYVDRGLLVASDVELAMRELGTDLISLADWAQRDVQQYGSIPDVDLISDIQAKGEDILKLRLALIRGENVSISEDIQQVEELFVRGGKVCDWRDENS